MNDNIITRHTKDGKFNLATALAEMEAKQETDRKKISDLEEAMSVMVEWWEKTHLNKIEIIPSTEISSIIKSIK